MHPYTSETWPKKDHYAGPSVPFIFKRTFKNSVQLLIHWICALTAFCRKDRKKTKRICVTKENRAREKHLRLLPGAPYGLYLRYREWVHSYLKAEVIGHYSQDIRENGHAPSTVPALSPKQIWHSEELVLPVLLPRQSSSEHFVTRRQNEEMRMSLPKFCSAATQACFIQPELQCWMPSFVRALL